MTKKHYFKILIAIVSCAAIIGIWILISQNISEDKPNIIFVNVDDLGWKDVHYMQGYDHYGKATNKYDQNNFYHTPAIDKLANNGVVFTRGYSPAPICTPSRIACLTGQDASRTKAHSLITTISRIADTGGETIKLYPWENHDSFDKNLITIPKMLKLNRYQTVHMGKFGAGIKGPLHYGFDINFAGGDQGSPQGVPKGGYFGYFNLNNFIVKDGEYLTDKLTDSVVSYIERYDRKEPFYLNLWYYNVHSPFQATQERIDFFDNRESAHGHDNPTYGAMIKAVDESIGRIVAVLENKKILDKTIIVFTSDNGGHKITKAPPLRGSKGTPFENGIRVPFFIHYPKKIKPGVIDDVVVTGLDIYPTLMDVAGIKSVPQELDGTSLMPLLLENNRQGFDDRNIYMYQGSYVPTGHGGRVNNYFEMVPGITVYNQRWKFMHLFEYNIAYLYDLKVGEETSVAESNKEIFDKMREEAENWMISRKVPLQKDYIENPNWNPETMSILGNPIFLDEYDNKNN
ncbi:MAG: sulfatase [Bacteroidetes bacterium]|jgi:arylsulfatase A-like enzyme|nr:sulfatase [Bacteroidota bacterium]